MQENRDGTFEPIRPFSEFMENMSRMDKDSYENVRAFHFGTVQELEEIKARKSLEQRFDALEAEMADLKDQKAQLSSEYVVFPTDEEVREYAAKGPMEKNMLKIMRGLSQK